MIKTKQDLKYYLDEDRKAYGKTNNPTLINRIAIVLYPDYNYEFMKCLRKLEYFTNVGGVMRWYYAWKIGRLRTKTGIDLTPNVAGPGLHVPHGKIVVNSGSKIGNHCKILSDVTIGAQGRYDVKGAPVIGNRVFVGSGSRVIGNISIADDCVIGANAVVVNDITEPGITVAGNPAKKISDNDSYHFLTREINN